MSAIITAKSNIAIPDYMLEQLPSAPIIMEDETDSNDIKWNIINTDKKWCVKSSQTSPLIYGVQHMEQQRKDNLMCDLQTRDGTKELLERLEYCIESESFQHKVWQRVNGISTNDAKEDVIEQGYVIITYNDVVNALAEFLILSYLEHYHKDKTRSVMVMVCKKIGDCIQTLLVEEAFEVLINWGKVFIPMSFTVFSFRYPETALFITVTMWKVLKMALF